MHSFVLLYDAVGKKEEKKANNKTVKFITE